MEPDRGFILHSADYEVDGTQQVSSGIALTFSSEVLVDIALGQGPRRSLIIFGYSGWGPAQLEGELARGDWTVTDADPDLVLGTDPREQVAPLARRHNHLSRLLVARGRYLAGPASGAPIRFRFKRLCRIGFVLRINADSLSQASVPWQRLNLRPEPHGQGALRPTLLQVSGLRWSNAARRTVPFPAVAWAGSPASRGGGRSASSATRRQCGRLVG